MANQLFKNFPEIQYKLSDGKIITIKDFFRKSKIDQAAVTNIIDYQFYELEEGDRPDVVATKLYGNGDLHWTLFLVNDYSNYYEWFKDSEVFENYIAEKYPHKAIIASNSSDIVSSTGKFLVGEKVTTVNGVGYVQKVEPTYNRIVVDVVSGSMSGTETITTTRGGEATEKSFVISSVIEHRDATAYYVDTTSEIRSNQFVAGYIAKTNWENEWELNEEKRKIKVINPQFIGKVESEFERIMKS